MKIKRKKSTKQISKARTLAEEIQSTSEMLKVAGKARSLLMKHHGERGRNNEDEVKKAIRKFLPQKMSLGTGTIECSDPSHGQSSQQDIVIYDGLNNTPLVEYDHMAIYPIEAIFYNA